MIFINNIPKVNPNVQYEGKTYPQDKVPLAPVPVDPNVNYNGQVFPRDRIQYQPPVADPTNQPSIIVIGGYQLPPDTLIRLGGKKVITKDAILDGVVVFEHISRYPYEIEFDIIIREDGAIPGFSTTIDVSAAANAPQPFPQLSINNVWRQVWLPDSVQTIQNTYLNNLGILEIVIESIDPALVRGSKNIPIRMRAYENVPGKSLIITTPSS